MFFLFLVKGNGQAPTQVGCISLLAVGARLNKAPTVAAKKTVTCRSNIA